MSSFQEFNKTGKPFIRININANNQIILFIKLYFSDFYTPYKNS